jgi:hypothetical protein
MFSSAMVFGDAINDSIPGKSTLGPQEHGERSRRYVTSMKRSEPRSRSLKERNPGMGMRATWRVEVPHTTGSNARAAEWVTSRQLNGVRARRLRNSARTAGPAGCLHVAHQRAATPSLRMTISDARDAQCRRTGRLRTRSDTLSESRDRLPERRGYFASRASSCAPNEYTWRTASPVSVARVLRPCR